MGLKLGHSSWRKIKDGGCWGKYFVPITNHKYILKKEEAGISETAKQTRVKTRIEALHNFFSVPIITRVIKSRRIRLAVHAERKEEASSTFKTLTVKPGGKSSHVIYKLREPSSFLSKRCCRLFPRGLSHRSLKLATQFFQVQRLKSRASQFSSPPSYFTDWSLIKQRKESSWRGIYSHEWLEYSVRGQM
jgi:hypothetical protein